MRPEENGVGICETCDRYITWQREGGGKVREMTCNETPMSCWRPEGILLVDDEREEA